MRITGLQRLFFKFKRLAGAVRSYGDIERDVSFRRLVEHSADVIGRVEQGRFTYVSPSVRGLFGWTPVKLLGREAIEIIHPDDRAEIVNKIQASISRRETSLSIRSRIVCADGSSRWCETNIAPDNEKLEDQRAVMVIRDISKRVQLEEELSLLALTDGLTGLKNRRAFDQVLQQECRRAIAEKSRMALLLLDVDHFKLFNDLYGHQAGDECLKSIARCLELHAAGPGHIACRYGGEEFAIVLGNTDASTAAEIAIRICKSVEALKIPHKRSMCGEHVTVSIGLSRLDQTIPHRADIGADMLRAADLALYNAKLEGRNRLHYCPCDGKYDVGSSGTLGLHRSVAE